jgi:Multicopper oxidase
VGTQNQVIVNGLPTRLVWAVNNVSNTVPDPHVALLDKAAGAARKLGWPAALADTVELPPNPPFPWNYSQTVYEPGGPGVAVGSVAESVVKFNKGDVFEFVMQNARALNNVTEFHPWHSHGCVFSPFF